MLHHQKYSQTGFAFGLSVDIADITEVSTSSLFTAYTDLWPAHGYIVFCDSLLYSQGERYTCDIVLNSAIFSYQLTYHS